MEVVTLLLLCAAAQMFGPAAGATLRRGALQPNLKDIVYAVSQYNNATTENKDKHFVEDVQKLYEEGCKDEFFCKVSEVLGQHTNQTGTTPDEPMQLIMSNLDVFNQKRCDNVTRTEKAAEAKPLEVLLDFLQKCCKKRNTYSGK